MDENNVHTSVVIELANQEEPKDQKTYQIDIDEVEVPKDYVIDQVFCGENITVYTLFEVSEDAAKSSDKRLVEVSSSNISKDFRFFHRNSFNNTMNEKKMNGYRRHALSMMHSEEDLKFITNKDKGNGSLYCLKHLGCDYDVLTPERKTSELKVLYSNEFDSKNTKPTKFKVVSKGVNTDIVQSPRIIEEVQKAVGLNIPFINNNDKNTEVSSSLSKSSYEVIEMEMRQSFTSLSSNSDCRRCSKKSASNFFLVPFLMMEDGALSHFKNEKKVIKEDQIVDSKLCIATKASLGTNTDLKLQKIEHYSKDSTQSESSNTDSENYEEEKICQKKEVPNEDVKLNSKEMIVQEIKNMQEKLNSLIKTIESNDFVFTTNEGVTVSDRKSCAAITDNIEGISEPLLCETLQKNYQDLLDRPIFLPFSYPACSNESKTKTKMRVQNTNQTKKSEILEHSKTSISNEFLSNSPSFTSVVNNDEMLKINPKAVESNTSNTNCQQVDNRKAAGLSKSESNVRIITFDVKHNGVHGLKKSLSLDLKDDKVEVLKKIKNFSFKLEGSLKIETNMRILQNKEPHSGDNSPSLKCEMGDDFSKKTKTSNFDLLNITQGDDKANSAGSKEISVDTKKTFNEEEGDAKLVYPKESLTLPVFEQGPAKMQYYNTSIVSLEGLLKPKKSLSPYRVKSRTIYKIGETGTNEIEKPVTPNKSCRKINSVDLNAKKDIKVTKKINNKAKVCEKTNRFEGKDVFQPELDKKKSLLSGIRKSTRNSADSKLHVDKLIKLDILSNHKIPSSARSNHEEKPGPKNDRLPRPISQKRERSEHQVDALPGEKLASELKVAINKSVTLVQPDGCQKKGNVGSNCKDVNEPLTVSEKQQIMQGEISSNVTALSSNPSSVVVELFSKKPKSVDEFYSEVGHECANLEKTLNEEKCGGEKESNENSNNQEKPIVKSVWALTKVLLFEDGTKKLEVLEASLTPPPYNLNQTLKSENEFN